MIAVTGRIVVVPSCPHPPAVVPTQHPPCHPLKLCRDSHRHQHTPPSVHGPVVPCQATAASAQALHNLLHLTAVPIFIWGEGSTGTISRGLLSRQPCPNFVCKFSHLLTLAHTFSHLLTLRGSYTSVRKCETV